MNIFYDEAIDELHSKLPIQYKDYLSWLDENGDAYRYKVLSTSNCQIRRRDDWNTLGREIYDRKKVDELAETTCEIIKDLNLDSFIAEHEYCRAVWFPEYFVFNNDNRQSFDFTRQMFDESETKNFSGVLRISDGKEAKEFIVNFIDYPFLFRYRNIDLISDEVALVIKFNSHLSVNYISQNQNILDRIASICDKKQLGAALLF